MLSKKFLVLLALLPVLLNCVACVRSGKESLAYSAAESFWTASIALGSIQVGDNSTYTIQNGHYVLNDTIIVKENATLIVRNAVLDFNMSSSAILECYDNATVNVSNSTFSHVYGYSYSYFNGNTSSTITDSSFLGNSYFYFYDTSNTSIGNSKAYDFYAKNNATVALTNTNAQYLYCYDFTKISVVSSVIGYAYVSDSSNVFMADSSISGRITVYFKGDSSLSLSLPTGKVSHWNLYNDNSVTKAYVNLTIINTRLTSWNVYCYDTSVISVADSSLDTLGAYANSTVFLNNCTIKSLNVQDYCKVTLRDSAVSSSVELTFSSGSIAELSLPQGHFTQWNLYSNNTVAVAYLNLTLQNVNVSSWNIDTYYSKISLTDSHIGYLYADENSTVSASNSTIYGIDCYTFSSTTLASTTVSYVYTYDSSTLSAADSTLSEAYAYGDSYISLSRVRIDYLGINDYASGLITDSLISSNVGLAFTADSNVSLASLPIGWVDYWNLYENATVVKAYVNLTLINTMIRGWGEFYAYENSAVSLRDSTIDYVDAYDLSQVTIMNCLVNYVYIYDNCSFSVAYSSIEGVEFSFKSDTNIAFNSLSTGLVDYWSLYGNSSVTKAYVNFTMSHSWIEGWDFTTYDSTTLTFVSCTVDSVYAYGSSNVSINTCTLNYLAAYDHATVSLFKTTVRYNVYAYDYSTLNVANSNLQSRLYVKFRGDSAISDFSPPTGLVNSWNLYKDATVKRAYLNLTISNTTISGWGFYVYESSTISFVNTHVEYLTANDLCTVTLENCTLENGYTYGLSQLIVTSIPTGQSVITYLYTYGTSTATLLESRAAIIYAYEYSTVQLTASDYGVARAYDQATIQLNWFLNVHVTDQASRNIANANVTITDKNGALVYSNQTDSGGWANLTLVGEVIDAMGSHSAGNYNVTAEYTGNTANEILEMTGNEQITISPQFIISELTLALILPFLLMALTVFAVVVRKLKWSVKPQTRPN